MKVTCPRCFGSPAVVCCALCRDERKVSQRVAYLYEKTKVKDTDAAIKIRKQDARRKKGR